MSAVLAPPQPPVVRHARFTRQQYYEMGDRGYFDGKRVERIRGEVVEKTRASWPHVVGTGNTADALRIAFAGIGWVNEQSPVTLPVTDSDPQPDVGVYPGRRTDFTAHPVAADALLVVEVSDTTLNRDLTVKAELYAEDGIAEYWVVDVNGRELHVRRDPVPLAAGGHHYRDQRTLTDADTVTPLAAPAQAVRVADLLP